MRKVWMGDPVDWCRYVSFGVAQTRREIGLLFERSTSAGPLPTAVWHLAATFMLSRLLQNRCFGDRAASRRGGRTRLAESPVRAEIS